MPNIQKTTIAREWLILICAIAVGIIYTVILFFPPSSEYLKIRRSLYDGLRTKYDTFDPSTAKLYIPRTSGAVNKRIPPPPIFEDDSISKSKTIVRKKVRYLFPLEDSFEPDIDTSIHLGTFESFSQNLDSYPQRKHFYDTISIKYDIGDYETFKINISSPPIFSSFPKFYRHLFAKWYWFDTWMSVLLPYILFQLMRSIFLSVKTLISKKEVSK
jgi:hypothetical protein